MKSVPEEVSDEEPSWLDCPLSEVPDEESVEVSVVVPVDVSVEESVEGGVAGFEF